MPALPPGATFGDLRQLALVVEVICQRCGNTQRLDGVSPRIAHRRVAGARYRCDYTGFDGRSCGGVGLPTLRTTPNYAGSSGRQARARRNV